MIDREGDAEFHDALHRAQDAVVAAYGIIGGKHDPTTPELHRGAKLALLELMAIEVRVDGQRRMAPYLALPAHLPSEDHELRQLYESRAPKDKPLRRDLLEWRDVNAEVLGAGVAGLKAICAAVRDGQELLDTETDPAARNQVYAWMKAVFDHAVLAFGVDPTTAPPESWKVEAWCRAKLARRHPVPEWLREARGRKIMFRSRATDAFTGRRDPRDDAEREAPPDDELVRSEEGPRDE